MKWETEWLTDIRSLPPPFLCTYPAMQSDVWTCLSFLAAIWSCQYSLEHSAYRMKIFSDWTKSTEWK